MTRRDFELIALVVSTASEAVQDFTEANDDPPTPAEVLYGLSFAFAEALALTNPRFDRERFLKACGVS